MKINVNEFIVKYNLKPSDDELLFGHSYNNTNDITYLVIMNDNTYITFYIKYLAYEYAKLHNGTVVVCKGEIKDE